MDPRKAIVLSRAFHREHALFGRFSEVAESFGFETIIIDRGGNALQYMEERVNGILFCDYELFQNELSDAYEKLPREAHRLPVVILVDGSGSHNGYVRNVDHYLFLDLETQEFEMLLFSIFKNMLVQQRTLSLTSPEFTKKLLSDTAHAINNILTGMTGYAELAQLNPEDRKLLEDSFNVVIDSANRVRNEIKNLRAFIRIEEPQFETINVHDALNESIHLLKKEIQTRNVQVQKEVQQGAMVHADYNQLVQVFFNVLGEIVTTIPENGSVSILLQSDDGHSTITMSSEQYVFTENEFTSLQRIFAFNEPVLKANSREGRIENRNVLSICNRIVHNHGGSILLDQNDGKVKFTLRIPVEKEYSSPVEEPAAEKHALEFLDNLDLDILVVDDEEYVRNTIYYFFDRKGCRVTMAEDGEFGLRVAGEMSFDLVFMDYLMPKMGGLEAARKIIENNSDTRIVFITGQESIEDGALYQDGVYGCIRKPFEMSDLYEIARKIAMQKGIVD
jgi:two-component system NtrC family sensor kinase